MERGWKAKGLLKPLYKKTGGRDVLAEKADASPQTLSAVNSGRQNLGEGLARRLAAATGISLAELGAPADVLDPQDRGVLARLAKLEDEALTAEDLQPLLGVVQLLVAGKRAEARRALLEAGVGP